jgi:hypothetical protein
MKNSKIMIILLIFFICSTVIHARMINPYDDALIMSSVNHYYSIIFDGEGGAMTSHLMDIRNVEQTEIKEFNIEIPSKQIIVYGAVQEITSDNIEVCTNWENQCVEYGKGHTCTKYDYDGSCLLYEGPCLRYDKVCINSYLQHVSSPTYQRVEYNTTLLSESTIITFNLKKPILKNKNTKIILMYKVLDMTKPSFGAYKVKYNTARTSIPTLYLQIAFDVQRDLYMKGISSNVNYHLNYPSQLELFSKVSSVTNDNLNSEINTYIENYAYNIKTNSGVVKSSSYLDPYESMTITGIYSKSWLRIYFINILLTIFGIVVICGLIFIAGRKILKYINYHFINNQTNVKKTSKSNEQPHTFMIPFFSGLISAITIWLFIGLGMLLIWLIDNYVYYLYDVFTLIIILFIAIASFVIMIGAPVYTGIRFGGLYALFTTLSIIVWLFIISIFILIFFVIFSYRIY